MKHNSFTDDGIPIFIVFKAMGFVSESEIVELICGNPQGGMFCMGDNSS